MEEESELDEALAALGLVAERPEEELATLFLWPENVDSWNLYQTLSTQWVVAMDGAVGLHYPGVESAMRMFGLKRRDRCRKFMEIQAMERASLIAWQEMRKDG